MAAITQEENNGFRFIKALNLCGRRVLHHVFCWGAPDKAPFICLDDYLGNLSQTSSANFLKVAKKDRKFNKTQKKLINMSPDGRGFDVPLLCLSIKLGCENVASVDDLKWITPSTEMEYYITAVKNLRNDALHSQLAVPNTEYLENIRKLREVLTGCLKASGERYGKNKAEVNKEMKQMNHDLDYIMNEILGMEDILKYCSDDIKKLIITDSSNELKKILQKISYINPFSYTANNFHIKADKFFTDIQIKQRKRSSKGEYRGYRELLQVVQPTSMSQQQSPSARPQILLLEGLAGSGKTTLVKLITEEWIQGGQGNMRGLDDYDLLLWVQCRDHTMNSYQDLLDRLIPDVSVKYRMVLPRIMKLCKVLIIVDGLDELNDHSRSLVESLLYEFQNSIYTTFICTSRPEKVEIFCMTIPEGYYVTNVELQGIKQEHMPDFVQSIHQIIKQNINSNSSTKLLIEKVMNVRDLYEHLRLPMNLAFFVYILEYAPDINLMTITQTRFYHKIHEICQKKLLERLASYAKTKAWNNKNLQYRVQEILRMIYLTSLENLSREQLTLEEETVERLISACNKLDLPYIEIFSAFLSMKTVWTWQGIEEQYSVPHKGIQDYFSALHCVMTLKDQLQSSAHTVSCIQNTTQSLLSQPLDTTGSPSHMPATFQSAPPTLVPPEPAALTPAPLMPSALKLVSPTPTPPLSLREVLTQSVGTASIDMTKYNNVLVHLAGLLHELLDQVPEVTTQEVVNLLHESGMREKNMWLNLLQNTRCNDSIAKAIAPFCSADYVDIDDKHVESYKALLPHTKRSEVNIAIKGNFGEMPGLVDLIEVVSIYHHRCTRLDLFYHYHQYDTTTSDEFLQKLQPRSHLIGFTGHLSGDGVSLLPPTLTDLHLCVVSNDHAHSLLPQLHHAVTTKLLYLEYFGVRIPAGVSPTALMPLPKSEKVNLTLTDVSDTCTDDAGVVIQALQPPGGYWDISFTSCTAAVVGIQDMIRGMADRGVKVMDCVTVDTVITKQQEDELVTLAKSTLQCRLTVCDVSTEVAKAKFD